MKIILIIVTSFILCGCNKIIIDELPGGYFLNIKSESVEVHSDIKLNDLIESTNVNASTNQTIDTHTIGNHIYSWEFKIDNQKYLYNINYKIIDTTSPKIFGGTSKTFYVGNEQDICNLVMYGDNYDKEPVCTIEGKYDFNKIGKYNITVVVTDSSNNSTEFNMNLKIIEPSENTNTNANGEPSNVLFADVVNAYKSDKTKIGIDVSRWQGDVDYKKVKSAGAEFVMMRIGVQQDLNQKPVMDSKFQQNIKNAKEAGLEVGVYFYSMAMNEKEAISQAEWVLKILDDENLELPIVFDWENWSDWNDYKLSFYDINTIADAFMETITKHGYETMLYGSKFYLQSIWENKKEYPVWLAHYTSDTMTDYKGEFFIWQLCSDGKIDGIEGDVDIDVMFLK